MINSWTTLHAASIKVKIMNVLHRSRNLLTVWCKSSYLLEPTSVFKGVSLLSEARSQSLTVNLATCKQRCYEAASPRCRFNATRYYCDNGASRHSESTGMFEEAKDEMDMNHKHTDSISPRFSETFTLDVLVSLLRQENAVDLCVIKVPDHIKYTEYFIVVSGVSPRHLRAMALYAVKVYKFLKKDENQSVKLEGKDAEDWMCIDFGNMVVHFMLPEAREVYELEKLWTLRAYDEQLKNIPTELLPEDFILDIELTK
ncbi:mitochondrial assembly of ribosomal large subunit protein 1 [Melanotaenia boesemani]|uniref:mitochondrial assembly of ribosomal large subunit protein 1 n=1 Tax=Melanotaenia boesemani TaxID=1250792 RepID=UPI001C05675A|nr:mitochondrial assembly of ribosomal large subunit protein 1 [Melanotaenia boesemani]